MARMREVLGLWSEDARRRVLARRLGFQTLLFAVGAVVLAFTRAWPVGIFFGVSAIAGACFAFWPFHD